jgi:multidrug efflux system membrane fusion protein
LGATATLVTDRAMSETPLASLPASALTQVSGQPAVWVVKHAAKEPVGSVELLRVTVHGYRNDEVLVSGAPAGEQVVTAGVQKMAPGLKVALPGAALAEARLTQVDTTTQQVAR